MSRPRYELKPGVNGVRVGSLVIGAHGHTPQDDAEQALLEAHPDLTKAKPKTAEKETT